MAWRRDQTDQYFPHPAPDAEVDEEKEDNKMGASLSLLKTLIIPAVISLIIYLLISYLVIPAWKRYRARYSQYLPLEAISTQTTSFRQRVQGALERYLVPPSWRPDFGENRYAVSAQDGNGSDFDEEEGEELSDVDHSRRLALSLDARRDAADDRRLSRELEEGFKDDSDDEDLEFNIQRGRLRP